MFLHRRNSDVTLYSSAHTYYTTQSLECPYYVTSVKLGENRRFGSCSLNIRDVFKATLAHLLNEFIITIK